MLPKVNQILHLQINSIDEEESRQEYKCRISDITEDYIQVEVPMNERTGRLKRLYAGDELSVYFMTEGGMKNYFTTTVLGFREEGIRTVIIRKPDPASITKIQRRSYLRVPAALDVAVKLGDTLKLVAVTDDVSGGGVSILCDLAAPFNQGDMLACWLLLIVKGKPDHIPFKGEIVRVKPLESGKLLVMLRFSEISDKDREKVIRYCFERQLEIRKV